MFPTYPKGSGLISGEFKMDSYIYPYPNNEINLGSSGDPREILRITEHQGSRKAGCLFPFCEFHVIKSILQSHVNQFIS